MPSATEDEYAFNPGIHPIKKPAIVIPESKKISLKVGGSMGR